MGFYGYYGNYNYVTVAQKQARGQAWLKKRTHANAKPVEEGTKLGVTWWGKSWNKNLERYAYYENRIGRGKSYIKNGFVLDLQIDKSVVNAVVIGSRVNPYKVQITIDPISKAKWESILQSCTDRIDSVQDLIAGSFPLGLKDVLEKEIFPEPKEIHFDCSCPDGAYMCKHVSAVLYAIGTVLDKDPLLFFMLRGIKVDDLISKSVESKTETLLKKAKKKSKRAIPEEEAHKLFGF